MRTLVLAVTSFAAIVAGATHADARCDVHADRHGRVWANGYQIALPADPAVPGARLAVYDAGARTLVARVGDSAAAEPIGSAQLWALTCAGVPTITALAHVPTADFGHAVLSGDASALLYTTADGAAALDLATGVSRAITQAPACGAAAQRDVVTALEHGELMVRRGGKCGAHGAWRETAIAIDDPLGHPHAHPARPIVGLAADAAGALYAVDGTAPPSACTAKRDPLWRSTDAGETWTQLALPAHPGEAITGVLADQRRAGYVIAQLTSCDLNLPAGGSLMSSHDAGATWVVLPSIVTAVGLVGGSIEHLVGTGTDPRIDAIERRESTDGGATWTPTTDTKTSIAPRLAPVSARGAKFYATSDGVVRIGSVDAHGTTRVLAERAALTAPPAQTCDATIDHERRIWVDGYATGLTVPVADPDEHEYDLEASVIRGAGAGTILLSYTWYSRYNALAGANTLWRATCGNPPAVSEAYSASAATLGYAVLDDDGHTLYFAGQAGIDALDLATKKVRGLTHPGRCTGDGDNERDFPTAMILDGHHLAFARGDHCGYEGEWDEWTEVIDVAAAPAPAAHPAPPVLAPGRAVSLVADAAGDLYVADGTDNCTGSTSQILRSTDHGATWTAVKIPFDTAPDLILADRTRAGHLVVQFNGCSNGGRGAWGLWAYATDNAGKTWRRINPTGVTADGSGADWAPYDEVDLVDGSTDHIVVHFGKVTRESAGKKWIASTHVIGPHLGGPVTVGADTFYPTQLGIERVPAGKP